MKCGHVYTVSPCYGDIFRALRTRKGWTAKEAALKCGLSSQTVYNWERSAPRTLMYATAQKVARVFGVPVSTLDRASLPLDLQPYHTARRAYVTGRKTYAVATTPDWLPTFEDVYARLQKAITAKAYHSIEIYCEILRNMKLPQTKK